jgi:hypothetical protein
MIMSKQPKHNEETRKELAKMAVELSDEELEKCCGGGLSFISYDALKRDVAVERFVRFGQLITLSATPANPYSRGCSEIERCRD